MGVALRPWFSQLGAPQAYISVFFMGDENWALTVHEFAAGRNNRASFAWQYEPLPVRLLRRPGTRVHVLDVHHQPLPKGLLGVPRISGPLLDRIEASS